MHHWLGQNHYYTMHQNQDREPSQAPVDLTNDSAPRTGAAGFAAPYSYPASAPGSGSAVAAAGATQGYPIQRVSQSQSGAAPVQRVERTGGLPSDLQSGLEAMSGIDLSDVRVHQNSAKPAQLKAKAFAQGSNIHLGPGQQQHLPHEAWHVVQQKQGRVGATVQMKGAAINDDPALEKEADVMGAKAAAMGSSMPAAQSLKTVANNKPVVQGRFIMSDGTDLRDYLRANLSEDLHNSQGMQTWFKTVVKPLITEMRFRYGTTRFMAILESERGEAVRLSMDSATPFGNAGSLLMNDLLASGLQNTKKRGIGKVTAMGRKDFDKFVKAQFNKPVMQDQLEAEARDVHLRHFVMGSWFRMIPDLLTARVDWASGTQDAGEAQAGVAVRIAQLNQALGQTVHGPMFVPQRMDLEGGSQILARILHDLPYNLNLGEGGENSLIGFASHQFNHLAVKLGRGDQSMTGKLVKLLIKQTIANLGLIESTLKAEFASTHMTTMLSRIDAEVVYTPAQLGAIFSELGFNFGMDFMKYEAGMPVRLQANPEANNAIISRLQGLLFPVGNHVLSMIVDSNYSKLSVMDVEKLLGAIEQLYHGLRGLDPDAFGAAASAGGGGASAGGAGASVTNTITTAAAAAAASAAGGGSDDDVADMEMSDPNAEEPNI